MIDYFSGVDTELLAGGGIRCFAIEGLHWLRCNQLHDDGGGWSYQSYDDGGGWSHQSYDSVWSYKNTLSMVSGNLIISVVIDVRRYIFHDEVKVTT